MKREAVKKGSGRCKAGICAAAWGLAAVLCTGCADSGWTSDGITSSRGENSHYSVGSAPSAGGSIYGGDVYDSESMPITEGTEDILNTGKLITRINLEVETKEFEQTMSGLETQIQNLGGYIESMEEYNGSSYSGSRAARYSNMTVRIPAAQLNSFLNTVSNVCNIIRRNKSSEDVTLSYVDMESRRDTLRTEQSRLLEFLDRADSVETVIALEERLSEVRYQLESMESRLRTIDNLVDYSTVNMKITEVRELTPIVEQTAWERVSSGFSESVQSIGNGFLEFGIWFVVNIPYFVIWAAVIAAAVCCWKVFRRRRRQKKERKPEEMQKSEAQRRTGEVRGSESQRKPEKLQEGEIRQNQKDSQ